MSYLLNVFYVLLLLFASPWLIYASLRKGKYRRGYAEKLAGQVPCRTNNRQCVWLHAVSVGEVQLIRTSVQKLARDRPELECVISTTTRTGYELANKLYPRWNVFYCPLDFSWSVRRAIRRVRPNLLVLVELELWPNLIRAAREKGVRVAVINGRLGEKSALNYRRIRLLVANLLASIDLVAVQNDQVAERFLDLGAPPNIVHVTGSLKFDGAETDRGNETTVALRKLAGLRDDAIVFLAGSTSHPEEAYALTTFCQLAGIDQRLRLVLVPRHPERFDKVAELIAQTGFPFARRSLLGQESRGRDCRILLVDTIGELGAWWGTADVAFVGGSLGDRGGQNMIEAAAYGTAVAFGPNTWNFRDVVAALLAKDAAVVVRDGTELTRFVRHCLDDPAWAACQGRRARGVVLRQLGATERTCLLLEEMLGKDPPGRLLRTTQAA